MRRHGGQVHAGSVTARGAGTVRDAGEPDPRPGSPDTWRGCTVGRHAVRHAGRSRPFRTCWPMRPPRSLRPWSWRPWLTAD